MKKSFILLLFVVIICGCREQKEHAVSMKLIEGYSFAELAGALENANQILAAKFGVGTPSDTGYSDYEAFEHDNPIYAILRPNIIQNADGMYFAGETSVIGYIDVKDTSQLLAYFRDSEIAALFPSDMGIMFNPNVMDNLSAYAIRKHRPVRELNALEIKHFEFVRTGLTGILGFNINDEASLFFIHPNENLTSKLSAEMAYTLVMTVDTTTYAGPYIKTDPPTSVNMNYISKQDKDVVEGLFDDKVINK